MRPSLDHSSTLAAGRAERVFLGWDEPALPLAAEWLIRSTAGPDWCDLQQTVCVVPGRRASRTLLAELARACQNRSLPLVPPAIITPGVLPEQTLGHAGTDTGALAAPLEQALAWTRVLQEASSERLRPLFRAAPTPPDLLAWFSLGRRLAQLHQELSGAEVTCEQIADEADGLLLHAEADRWRAIGQLVRDYEAALERANLIDPYAAWTRALKEELHRGNERVILVGITELTAFQRRLLDACDHVVSLIFAPPELADRFDALGCVIPEAWSEVALSLKDEQFQVADGPGDQAQAAIAALVDLQEQFDLEQITIGMGDESLAPALVSAGRWAQVDFHHASGRPLVRTAPLRLLQLIADWLEERSLARTAALVRHPDLERWLETCSARADDWPSALDRYASEHLPRCFGPPWLGGERHERLARLAHTLDDLLAPLASAPQPLGAWAPPLLGVLRDVYAPLESSLSPLRAARLLTAATALGNALSGWRQASEPLQPALDAVTAIRLALAIAAEETLADEPRPEQIELLGWLELALDPAPALVVTGVNDGFVPGAVHADPFLPDQLRLRLGMLCNQRRYARDAYLLEALLHQRKHVLLITGRRTAEGEPLTPSRLVLATEDSALAPRVLRLSDEHEAFQATGWIGAAVPAGPSAFRVPEPTPPPIELNALPVTAFRDYLQCPYRFWLARIEKLKRVEEIAPEMNALQFGTLAHAVLQRLGEEAGIASSEREQEIADFLVDTLQREARGLFGDQPPAAVRVQLARLRRRLEAFAHHQAAHRRDGWIIDRTEFTLPDDASLEVPGQRALHIRGKVDRIDRNERDGRWLIIDYKTGERGKRPEAAHQDGERWIDLQLPLYHHLLQPQGITGHVELAYFNLPNDPEDTELCVAGWSDSVLREAVDEARRVVREIRAGHFEMNGDYPAQYRDPFQAICQSAVLGGADEPDGGAS